MVNTKDYVLQFNTVTKSHHKDPGLKSTPYIRSDILKRVKRSDGGYYLGHYLTDTLRTNPRTMDLKFSIEDYIFENLNSFLYHLTYMDPNGWCRGCK